MQNRERHAGPEAIQNGLLASTGIEILWFATPSEREREFCTCFRNRQKSIEDSSKKLEFPSCNKIVISVVDDIPTARMAFLQLSTLWRCEIRTLAREIQCSARHCSPSRFKSRSCHVRAWNLSSWSLELVTFKPGSCQVQAWNLSSSSLGLVRLEPRTWRSRTRESASSRRSLAEKPTGILSSSSRKRVTRTPHAATKPTSCRRRETLAFQIALVAPGTLGI